jgi:hypothetical protein
VGNQSISELAKKKDVVGMLMSNIISFGLDKALSKYNVDLIVFAIVMLAAV